MKTGGFITIHRQILDWEWFEDSATLHLFIFLLLSANYVDGNFKGRVIKRGQLVTSLPKISTGTGLSIRQARTALEHLKSTGEVTDESSSQYRVITIVKYDQYQNATDDLTGNRQAIDRRSDRQTTDDLTGNRQQYNNNNNYNKETNKQGNNIISFDRFWEAYPRKEGKPKAKTVFDKLKPDEGLLQRMLDSIERWKRTDQWQEDGGRYIPHPSTWLNQRRWEDEPMPAKKAEVVQHRVIPAQDFQQRDYSGVQNEMFLNLKADLEKGRREGII